MKVLLINPPWETKDGYGCRSNTRWPHTRKDKYLIFPIYLAYTAAVLEKEKIEVKVIDAVALEYSSGSFIERIKEEKPDICFVETSTPTIIQDLINARLIKEFAKSKVFIFGTHATVFHKEIMDENRYLDGIIRGEFEYTIKELCLNNDLALLNGITYIDKGGAVKVNPERPLIENLDELPFPAWYLFDMKVYESHLYRSPSMMMITSRGCPFQCTYCLWPDLMYGHKQRYRSAKNICDEIEALINLYKVKEIRLDDDTFALNPGHVLGLCNELKKRGLNKKISWTCFGHIAQDDENIYKELASSGCFKIDFGVESGSPKVLKYMKKSIDPDKARKVVSLAKRAGLLVYCDFMIGFPHETKEDIEMSIELAGSLDCDYIQVSYVIPYPGTRMYNDGIKENFLLYPKDWEKYASCTAMINTGEISPEAIDKYYNLFWKKFYLRPKIIFRTLRRALTCYDEFKRALKGFISFTKRMI
ncbi:MAG: radical SAM protein [Elusimicrobia bacterium]|nr:radical SAM protein [Candidatus Liberimonas magnetica]